MQNSIKKTERVLRLFYRFFCEDAEGFLRPSRCAFPFDAGRYFPTSVRILLCRNKSRLNRNVLRLPSCFSLLRLKRRLFPPLLRLCNQRMRRFFRPRRRAFKRRRVLEQRRETVMPKRPSVWKTSERADQVSCKFDQTDRHSLFIWPRGTPHRRDVGGGLSGRSLPTEPRCV